MVARWIPLWAAALLAATTSALAGSAAGAPSNLVTNGTFDTSVASWSGAEWNSADANGSAASGSARVINNNPYMDYMNARYGTQCIQNIETGVEYRMTGQVFIPAGQLQGARGAIGVDGYSGPACTGSWILGGSDDTGTQGSWQSLEATFTFPEGARSAMIMLQSSKQFPVNPSAPVTVLFDNVTLGPPTAGPPPAAFELFVPGVAATR